MENRNRINTEPDVNQDGEKNEWETVSDVEFAGDNVENKESEDKEPGVADIAEQGWAKMTGYYKKNPDKVSELVREYLANDNGAEVEGVNEVAKQGWAKMTGYYKKNPDKISDLVQAYLENMRIAEENAKAEGGAEAEPETAVEAEPESEAKAEAIEEEDYLLEYYPQLDGEPNEDYRARIRKMSEAIKAFRNSERGRAQEELASQDKTEAIEEAKVEEEPEERAEEEPEETAEEVVEEQVEEKVEEKAEKVVEEEPQAEPVPVEQTVSETKTENAEEVDLMEGFGSFGETRFLKEVSSEDQVDPDEYLVYIVSDTVQEAVPRKSLKEYLKHKAEIAQTPKQFMENAFLMQQIKKEYESDNDMIEAVKAVEQSPDYAKRHLIADIESKKKFIEKRSEDLKRCQEEIDNLKKTGFFNRLLNSRKIQTAKDRYEWTKKDIDNAQKEVANLEERIKAFDNKDNVVSFPEQKEAA